MSIILDNEELIKQWKEENEINKDNIIPRFMQFIANKAKLEYMEEEIEFINNNFDELEKEIEFEKIPSKYLCQITKNVKGIKSEEKIFNYIIQRLEKEEEENNRKKLIESIEVKGLNQRNFQKLISNINYHELSEEIFSILKSSFLTMLENKRMKKERELNDIIEDIFKNRIKGQSEYDSQILKYLENSDTIDTIDNKTTLNHIGDIFRTGIGVTQDYSKAMEYYLKAAEKENVNALLQIGILYQHRFEDYSNALEYYQKAADKGNSYSLFKIGYLYLRGFGVKQDESIAIQYFLQSGQKGFYYAYVELVYLYLDKYDVEKAKEYCQKAIDNGCSYGASLIERCNEMMQES